jgi:penicillin-binding protein 2
MTHSYTFKNTFSESRVFLSRIVAAFIVIVLLMICLVVKLIYLQISGHDYYTSKANNNRIKISPLPPTRGIIYDRNGKILAENLPSYRLEIIPEQIEDIDKTLARLQKLLDIPDEKIAQFHKQRKRQKRFTSTPLIIRMNDQQVAKFAVVRPYFPGVDIHARLLRHYPYGELAAHVIGYIGRINETELRKLPESNYRGTHHVGKIGIEKAYESELHGQTGHAEIETNAQSRPIKTLNSVAPIPGGHLHLALDIELQATAYHAFEQYNGAAVALEIPSGNVLTLVSHPSFDPNPFVYGISSKAYKALQQSDDQPLFDRAIRGQYPPGSTVKPFIGLAGLEYQAITMRKKYYCPGYYRLPNLDHKYRDWKKWGHGRVDLTKAITQSCDVYFYNLAMALGIDQMHKFMSLFGFGKRTGIDLVGEKAGLMPSKQWKRKNRNLPWFPGETVITGIGQGFSQVTSLQLARATATLANRGKVITPRLVENIEQSGTIVYPEVAPEVIIKLDQTHVDNVIAAMTNVIHGLRGTARKIGNQINYKMAGKTGTAQVFTVKQEQEYSEDEISFKLRDHALFIAFAPADAPKIAVAVIVENGGHGGSVAAPIALKIINQYLGIDTANEERNPS